MFANRQSIHRHMHARAHTLISSPIESKGDEVGGRSTPIGVLRYESNINAAGERKKKKEGKK